MKLNKIILISTILLMGISMSACGHHSEKHSECSSTSVKVKHHSSSIPKDSSIKTDLHKKYKGFKSTTVPTEYRGTWYRGNPYDKKATKLVITEHTINGAITYRKIDPNLKLDRYSEKENKEYAGNAVMISTDDNSLKERGFLDAADMVYKNGNFKGKTCLFMSYGTNPKAVNGVAFKDKSTALKYRKYDFSKVSLEQKGN